MSMSSRDDEPDSMMTGQPFSVASFSGMRPFMKPGADTVRYTPGLPVMKPSAAAALPASASWRMPM